MKRIIKNPALNDTVTFLQTSMGSRGKITELEILVMPGGYNPPHYHTNYDETVTLLEGELTLYLSGEVQIDLVPGDSRVIMKGQVHSLKNASHVPLRLNCTIVPGNEGFESSLRIMYGLASDGLYNESKMPHSLVHLAICAVMSDTRFVGIKSLLNPLFAIIERYGRWKGIEKQLRNKYCI